MSIYVVEQGRRVATPVDALFPRRGVQAVVRTGRVEPIHGQPGAASYSPPEVPPRDNPIDAYREQAEPPHTRHKVLQAADLMSTHLHCLQPFDPLAAAWKLMQRHDFHHVLVTQADNVLIGILSDRDVWRALSIQPTQERYTTEELRTTAELNSGTSVFESLRVQDMMTAKVVCAAADTSIRRLAEVMLLHGIDALPVTDDAQQLLGLVTRTDLLRALVLDAPVELWV